MKFKGIGKNVFWLVLAGLLVLGYFAFTGNCNEGQLKNDILEKNKKIAENKIALAEAGKTIRDQAEKLEISNNKILAMDGDIEKAGKLAVESNKKAKTSRDKIETLISEAKDWPGLKKQWKTYKKKQSKKYNDLQIERNLLFDQNKKYKVFAKDALKFKENVLDYLDLSELIINDFEDQLKKMLKLHNKRLGLGITIGPGVHGEGFSYMQMTGGLTLRLGKTFLLPESYKKLSILNKMSKNIRNNKTGGQ